MLSKRLISALVLASLGLMVDVYLARAFDSGCDLTVNRTIRKMVDDYIFSGSSVQNLRKVGSCSKARSNAYKKCVNSRYEFCTPVQAKCEEKVALRSITYTFDYIGYKYKTIRKSKDQIRQEECDKLAVCEDKLFNDLEAPSGQMEKLLMLKREYDC